MLKKKRLRSYSKAVVTWDNNHSRLSTKAWHQATIDEHRVPASWQVLWVMTSCGMFIEECSVGYSSRFGLLMSWWSSVAQLFRRPSSNLFVNWRRSWSSKSRLASWAYCAPRSAFTAAWQQENMFCYKPATRRHCALGSGSRQVEGCIPTATGVWWCSWPSWFYCMCKQNCQVKECSSYGGWGFALRTQGSPGVLLWTLLGAPLQTPVISPSPAASGSVLCCVRIHAIAWHHITTALLRYYKNSKFRTGYWKQF